MNEFKVNEYITLKLDNGRTNIYVNNELFQQCKFLLLDIPVKEITSLEDIESIDAAAERLDRSLEPFNGRVERIPPRTEFWGHCSNLQAWYEYDYDTRLLHSHLAFPLLRKLTHVGDPLAKKVFKEEIAKRIESNNPKVVFYLILEGYLDYMEENEIISILDKSCSSIVENFLLAAKDYRIINDKWIQLFLKEIKKHHPSYLENMIYEMLKIKDFKGALIGAFKEISPVLLSKSIARIIVENNKQNIDCIIKYNLISELNEQDFLQVNTSLIQNLTWKEGIGFDGIIKFYEIIDDFKDFKAFKSRCDYNDELYYELVEEGYDDEIVSFEEYKERFIFIGANVYDRLPVMYEEYCYEAEKFKNRNDIVLINVGIEWMGESDKFRPQITHINSTIIKKFFKLFEDDYLIKHMSSPDLEVFYDLSNDDFKNEFFLPFIKKAICEDDDICKDFFNEIKRRLALKGTFIRRLDKLQKERGDSCAEIIIIEIILNNIEKNELQALLKRNKNEYFNILLDIHKKISWKYYSTQYIYNSDFWGYSLMEKIGDVLSLPIKTKIINTIENNDFEELLILYEKYFFTGLSEEDAVSLFSSSDLRLIEFMLDNFAKIEDKKSDLVIESLFYDFGLNFFKVEGYIIQYLKKSLKKVIEDKNESKIEMLIGLNLCDYLDYDDFTSLSKEAIENFLKIASKLISENCEWIGICYFDTDKLGYKGVFEDL